MILNRDKRKALGRGLDSLLPGSVAGPGPAGSSTNGAQEIPVDLIDPNPFQTRSRISEDSLNELAESIRASGVIQPIVLRAAPNGRYQVVAGERRWLASKRAGKVGIPAVVRQISNEQALELTIIENLQREDLNPIEQARAFERLSREFGLTQEQIALRTGKDRASIANFIRLLKLPADLQEAMENGLISFGHGKVLMSLTPFPEQLQHAAQEVMGKQLSVRQTEELVAKLQNPEPDQDQPKKSSRPSDPNVREAEKALERTLGVKVEIHDRKGKGKIVLRYASLEDFDRIVAGFAVK